MKSLLKNKKGSIQDVFFITVILFSTAIFLLIMLYTTNKLSTTVGSAFNNITTDAGTNSIGKIASIFNSSFDYLYLGMFIAYLIAIIITSFMMRTHPIFIPIFIILLIVGEIGAVAMSNTYQIIINNPEFVTTSLSMPIVSFVMTKLPLIFAIIGILAMIILFSKTQQTALGGGYQGEP